MSDAVAAVVVQADAQTNRIVEFFELAQTYYWDPAQHPDELLAAYFPLSQRAILGCLDAAGLTTDDVRWFVPHNVSARSWEILARLIGIPAEKVWMGNIARVGHTVSCDHIINLVDMEAEGRLNAGDRLLLFTFGFGARWTCLLIDH
jgi:3-oxoacyl-[acyl-carrier-protein] synthase III